MTRSYLWPIIITVSFALVTLGMNGFIGQPLQPILTFWFFLICPGIAFVRLLDVKDTLSEVVFTLALSITIDTIVSGILVLNGNYSAWLGLIIVGAISLVGAGLQLIKNILVPR